MHHSQHSVHDMRITRSTQKQENMAHNQGENITKNNNNETNPKNRNQLHVAQMMGLSQTNTTVVSVCKEWMENMSKKLKENMVIMSKQTKENGNYLKLYKGTKWQFSDKKYNSWNEKFTDWAWQWIGDGRWIGGFEDRSLEIILCKEWGKGIDQRTNCTAGCSTLPSLMGLWQNSNTSLHMFKQSWKSITCS